MFVFFKLDDILLCFLGTMHTMHFANKELIPIITHTVNVENLIVIYSFFEIYYFVSIPLFIMTCEYNK